jgi:hypothetical protein
MLRSSSVIIHDLYIPGVSVPELESDPPRPAGRDCPLTCTRTAEAVKAHRRQPRQVFEALGFIEQSQPSPGQGFIEAGEAPLPFLRKTLRGPVGPGLDHLGEYRPSSVKRKAINEMWTAPK